MLNDNKGNNIDYCFDNFVDRTDKYNDIKCYLSQIIKGKHTLEKKPKHLIRTICTKNGEFML